MFCFPRRVVFRPVIDKKEKSRRRNSFDQAVEEALGFRIDPVEILENEKERLGLAFPQKQTLDCFQCTLAALGRIQYFPSYIVDGTSKSERTAGRVDSKVLAKVSSLPVTFSRILRVSSRFWISK